MSGDFKRVLGSRCQAWNTWLVIVSMYLGSKQREMRDGGPWRAPCQLKKPFEAPRPRRIKQLEGTKANHILLYCIYPPRRKGHWQICRTGIYLSKREKNELVARPAMSIESPPPPTGIRTVSSPNWLLFWWDAVTDCRSWDTSFLLMFGLIKLATSGGITSRCAEMNFLSLSTLKGSGLLFSSFNTHSSISGYLSDFSDNPSRPIPSLRLKDVRFTKFHKYKQKYTRPPTAILLNSTIYSTDMINLSIFMHCPSWFPLSFKWELQQSKHSPYLPLMPFFFLSPCERTKWRSKWGPKTFNQGYRGCVELHVLKWQIIFTEK